VHARTEPGVRPWAQVCVGELPDGFSARTGQGRWSDQHTGFNWCICIWAYANFITQHDADELPIQCDAIPEQVRARRLCRLRLRDDAPVCSRLQQSISCGPVSLS
jgi:hypothetical protein